MLYFTSITTKRCTLVQSTVVWAVRLSIGNTRFRPHVEQKRVNRSKPNLAGVTMLGEYIRSAKNVWVLWAVAPPRDGRLSNFCDCSSLFSPVQPTGQTRLSPTTYYASNDVVPLLHVPFERKSSKISHFGGLRPQNRHNFSPNREIPSESKMDNNFKRWEIDKKL